MEAIVTSALVRARARDNGRAGGLRSGHRPATNVRKILDTTPQSNGPLAWNGRTPTDHMTGSFHPARNDGHAGAPDAYPGVSLAQHYHVVQAGERPSFCVM
jgi:hypothetical protein